MDPSYILLDDGNIRLRLKEAYPTNFSFNIGRRELNAEYVEKINA